METVVLVLIGIILVVLLVLLRNQKNGERPVVHATGGRGYRTCPLCGEQLAPGESVKSALYPAEKGASDRMMEIYGCPHCYPAGKTRYCPVCKKELAAESMLIARCFQKPGKTHVHVLGCPNCYRKK